MTAPILSLDDPDAHAAAEAVLRRGGLVAIPTETVYGLAADATDGAAVAAIFAAKQRPAFNPLIAHIADRAMAEREGVFSPLASELADRFWPGPLTIVVPRSPQGRVHALALNGLGSIALRMPRGPMRDLAGALGRPLAAPSANPSGRVSPTSAAAVASAMSGRVDLILDGGSCAVGLESTIVRVANGGIEILRPGGITAEVLAAASGRPVNDVVVHAAGADGAGVVAPGQLSSHYAPAGRVRLEAHHIEPGEHLIAFGDRTLPGEGSSTVRFDLSRAGDLAEAAAKLFAALRHFDSPLVERIAVMPVPHEGLGVAINDRLRRAAAPR